MGSAMMFPSVVFMIVLAPVNIIGFWTVSRLFYKRRNEFPVHARPQAMMHFAICLTTHVWSLMPIFLFTLPIPCLLFSIGRMLGGFSNAMMATRYVHYWFQFALAEAKTRYQLDPTYKDWKLRHQYMAKPRFANRIFIAWCLYAFFLQLAAHIVEGSLTIAPCTWIPSATAGILRSLPSYPIYMLVVFISFKVWKVKDSLGIKTEFKIYVCTAITVNPLGTWLATVTVGGQLALISAAIHVGLWIFYGIPLIMSYQDARDRLRHSDATKTSMEDVAGDKLQVSEFGRMLLDPTRAAAFRKHLFKELAVENLLFFNDAIKFEKTATKNVDDTSVLKKDFNKKVSIAAGELYYEYVDERGILQVNLKQAIIIAIRDELKAVIGDFEAEETRASLLLSRKEAGKAEAAERAKEQTTAASAIQAREAVQKAVGSDDPGGDMSVQISEAAKSINIIRAVDPYIYAHARRSVFRQMEEDSWPRFWHIEKKLEAKRTSKA